jgi:hypothetical protein
MISQFDYIRDNKEISTELLHLIINWTVYKITKTEPSSVQLGTVNILLYNIFAYQSYPISDVLSQATFNIC